MPDYDPIAVEIHRKAMDNISQEMALTLARTSGSPVVTEGLDFCTCLLDEQGEPLSMAGYTLIHSAASWLGTRALVEHLAARDQTPEPGDGWVLSDPYKGGALHQGDVGIITPAFYRGEHVGWGYANVHVLDIGGVGVSGFAPGARSVYEEGLRFPMLQIIRDGELDAEWDSYIRTNVRTPDLVINDIRSMLAANNVAQEKLTEVIDRFGLERHREYAAINCDLTESLMRKRIEAMPDGVYTGYDWTEFDGQDRDLLLEVRCELEVDGGDLRFKFTAADQLDATIGASVGGLYGWLMSIVMTTLCYGDLPYNAGIWRPISIDLGPEGTIVNLVPPAPVSIGHGATALRVSKVTKELLNQAMSLSEDPVLRGRVAGSANDLAANSAVFGNNQYGVPSVMFYFDSSSSCGGGALAGRDGMDFYGYTTQASAGITDIEVHEAMYPVLFLWRRGTANSGGAGQWRGGLGNDVAYELRYTDRMAGNATTYGAVMPPRGTGGGYPSTAAATRVLRGANVDEVAAKGAQPVEAAIEGEIDERPCFDGSLILDKGDVLHHLSGGGGGVGDPLLRDLQAIADDVAQGFVSAKHAAAAYGLVLAEDGSADVEATRAAQEKMLAERIGQKPARELQAPKSPGISIVIEGDDWACGHCGSALCSTGDNWREADAVVRLETPVPDRFAQLDMPIRPRGVDPQVTIREYFCGECAAALRAEAAPEGFEYPTPKLAQAIAVG